MTKRRKSYPNIEARARELVGLGKRRRLTRTEHNEARLLATMLGIANKRR